MSGRNRTFDRLRGIGAVCVVVLHAPPLYHSGVPALRAAGWLLREFSQSAVPYFFLLSGWILGTKWAKGRTGWDEVVRSTGRILSLYLPWFAVFAAIDVAQGLPHGWTVLARRLVGFSDATLDTRGYHLWFLPCLVLAQLASWSLLKAFRSALPAVLLGGCVYLALAGVDLAGGRLPWNLVPHEALDLSLVCTSLGLLMGLRAAAGKGRAAGPWIVALAAALVAAESVATGLATGQILSIHAFQVTRVAFPAVVLLWAAGSPSAWGDGPVGRFLDLLGENSAGIYVSHLLFLTFIPFESLVPNGFVRDNLVRWPLVVACALLLSWGLSRSRLSWIRGLVR